MPEFGVFWADGVSAVLEAVTAEDELEAQSKVLSAYPKARTAAVPAEMLEGCRPQVVLCEWLRSLRG
jgi:hypothetical protein